MPQVMWKRGTELPWPGGVAAAALGPARVGQHAHAQPAQPVALLARGELHVGTRPAPRPLVLGTVEAGAAEPVLPGELERVLDPPAALLRRVHEEQPAERPERLAAERRLGLLVEQQHAAAGVGQLGGGGQPGQAGADDDHIGFRTAHGAGKIRDRTRRAGTGNELFDRTGAAGAPRGRRGDPAARLRRVPGAAGGHGRDHDARLPGRLPAHRHRRGVPQRGGGRAGLPRLRPRPRGRLHHDQVLQHRPRLRGGEARAPRQPGPARARLRGPLPDPLAGPGPRQVRGDLEGLHRGPGAGARARHRRVELPARPPAPAGRRDGGHAGRQPGGAPPALPAAGTAPRARGPRDRDRGMEPAGPGRGPGRPGDHRGSPRRTTAPPARW